MTELNNIIKVEIKGKRILVYIKAAENETRLIEIESKHNSEWLVNRDLATMKFDNFKGV